MRLSILVFLLPLALAFHQHKSKVERSSIQHMKRNRKHDRVQTKTNYKRPKKGNIYSPVGYSRGDVDTLKTMFDENSVGGLLSYDSFIDSRYLRYWPGSDKDAECIWNDILGSCEESCSFEELKSIQKLLDEMSLNVETEMERERILWNIESVTYDHMENFFLSATNKSEQRLLSFKNFIEWEFIKAELWFHDGGGLTKKKLEELWCEHAGGDISLGLNFDQFGILYNQVCQYKYQV